MYIPSEWVSNSEKPQPLEAFESSKPMIFASVFPVDSTDLEDMYCIQTAPNLQYTVTFNTAYPFLKGILRWSDSVSMTAAFPLPRTIPRHSVPDSGLDSLAFCTWKVLILKKYSTRSTSSC